jgi:NitT/TauT family transport system ATP-binding protein
LEPDSGTVKGIDQKKISYVFQEPRLLPWKTVRKNIEFVLTEKYPEEQARNIAQKYIKLVHLENFTDYYPAQLSGGMKQRVSLARAFSYPSELILMDEPFKGLDHKLKFNLMSEFRDLWEHDQRTVIMVSHDVDEAIDLGDTIFIFSEPPVKIIDELSAGVLENDSELRNKIIDQL